MKFKVFLFLLIYSVFLSGCFAFHGMLEEKLSDGTEKVNIIIYIGTRDCLNWIFCEGAWSSAGHPGISGLSDFPLSFSLDTISLPYTISKSVWNLYNEWELSNNQENIKPVSGKNLFYIFIIIFWPILFSILGYYKAKQKGLSPIFWGFVCFFYNIWGYLFLSFHKKKNMA